MRVVGVVCLCGAPAGDCSLVWEQAAAGGAGRQGKAAGLQPGPPAHASSLQACLAWSPRPAPCRRRLPFGGKQYLAFKEAHLGSVVGVLLSHELPQLRKLGVDLLIDFIKCQVCVCFKVCLCVWACGC